MTALAAGRLMSHSAQGDEAWNTAATPRLHPEGLHPEGLQPEGLQPQARQAQGPRPQDPQAEAPQPDRPGAVFIVGMPRSGTKLLRGLLNQHPSVRILDIETDFFPFLVRWVREHGEVQTSASFARLHAAMRSAPYFAHRRSQPLFSPEEWRLWCDRFDAGGLFEAFVRYETDTPRVPQLLWGDKSPGYIRHIELLLEHFPNGRVVHIVRDVRDYCASMRKAWNKDVRRAAFLWGRHVGSAHHVCHANMGRCLQLRYEDLLQAPQPQLERVCRSLSIEFTAAMTRLKRPEEQRGNASGATEILRNNFAGFSRHLTRREIADIERLAFDTMHLVGLEPLYAQRQRTMSAFEERLRRLRDAAHLVSRSRSKLGLAGALRFHITHRRLAN